jgi:hypothetical protein
MYERPWSAGTDRSGRWFFLRSPLSLLFPFLCPRLIALTALRPSRHSSTTGGSLLRLPADPLVSGAVVSRDSLLGMMDDRARDWVKPTQQSSSFVGFLEKISLLTFLASVVL